MLFDRIKTIRFVESHCQSDGGYSFSIDAPSTGEDTYYAVRTLGFLKGRLSLKTKRYIQQTVSLSDQLDARSRWRMTWLCHRFQIKTTEILPPVEGRSMADLYYSIKTRRLVRQRILLLPEAQDFIDSRTPANLRLIPDIAYYLLLSHELGHHRDVRDWVERLRTGQGYEGGYGFVPFSTEFLDVTYLVLMALRAYTTSPIDAGRCHSFVSSCLTNNGGYARRPQAAPAMEATYFAISSLESLQKY